MDTPDALWRYVALEDYPVPRQPAAARVRSSLSAWIARLTPSREERQQEKTSALLSPDASQLDALIPALNKQEFAAALDKALEGSSTGPRAWH